LHEIGIKLYWFKKYPKSMKRVLKELSKKWKHFDEDTQNIISTTVAGKKQIAEFESYLENINR